MTINHHSVLLLVAVVLFVLGAVVAFGWIGPVDVAKALGLDSLGLGFLAASAF